MRGLYLATWFTARFEGAIMVAWSEQRVWSLTAVGSRRPWESYCLN